MTVRINKPAINLREKLAELDKPSGIVGEQVLRSDTAEDAREALNLEEHLFENFESTGIQDNATSTKVTVSDTGVSVTGKIGIGTSSPQRILDIQSDSGDADARIYARGTTSTDDAILYLGIAGTTATNRINFGDAVMRIVVVLYMILSLIHI